MLLRFAPNPFGNPHAQLRLVADGFRGGDLFRGCYLFYDAAL